MPGQENLQSIIKELDTIASDVNEEDSSIDSMIQKATRAVELYGRFKKACDAAAFEVMTVRITDQTVSEHPFDWKNLV